MGLEYQDVGKDRSLCGYVSGIVPWSTSLKSAQNLMLKTGHGHCNRDCDPNTLEVPGQPQR